MRQVPTAPAAGKSGLCSAISRPARSTPLQLLQPGAAPEERRIRLQSKGPICRTESVRIFRADSRGPPRKGAHAAGADGTCGRKNPDSVRQYPGPLDQLPFSFCGRAPLLRSGASGCSRAGPILPNRVGPDFPGGQPRATAKGRPCGRCRRHLRPENPDSVRQYPGPLDQLPLQLLQPGAALRSGASGCSRAGPYCRTESVRIFRADSRGPPRKGAHAAGADGTCGRKIRTLFGNIRARSINSPSASAAGRRS